MRTLAAEHPDRFAELYAAELARIGCDPARFPTAQRERASEGVTVAA